MTRNYGFAWPMVDAGANQTDKFHFTVLTTSSYSTPKFLHNSNITLYYFKPPSLLIKTSSQYSRPSVVTQQLFLHL
ncbi:hypothetical protein HZS61_016305 [Fusarium oxysporum f. sp. conglutinans]|uniref:Uncharacterized protein n=1 Tax=Fusarium oxysporum f. sp. conglutinans TaxID=100902 RepID=A0A8H6LHS4_FUSOX|nr:hypothetical protein HZS61_016305 [Fusarium oxysporum f. sp. conglutinans]